MMYNITEKMLKEARPMGHFVHAMGLGGRSCHNRKVHKNEKRNVGKCCIIFLNVQSIRDEGDNHEGIDQ